MIVYPAIDIFNGNAVRLTSGDYNKCKVYGTPSEMAEKWESLGAEYIHIVDLNGARGEKTDNIKIIEKLAVSAKCRLQVGGGVRSMSDITRYLDCGVYRIVLGSACVNDIDLVRSAIELYGSEHIACGVDSRNGKVAVNGWLSDSEKTTCDVCSDMRNAGVSVAICTDISRDGSLSGVNKEQIFELTKTAGMNIIASGGVNSLDDVKLLKKYGASGVIIGKALYEKRFSLPDALAVAKE